MKTKQGLLFGIAAMLFAAVCILSGCNDPSKDDSSPTVTVTGVTVTPQDQSIVKGGTLTFTAKVEGSNNPSQIVTWRVTTSGVKTGTAINTNTGELTVAANETKLVIKVEATAAADTTKSGTATVELSSSVTNIAITSDKDTVNKGGTVQFTADVTGPGNPPQTVTWKVIAGGQDTVFSEDGLLKVARNETYPVIMVKATSTVEPTVSATATVSVNIEPFYGPKMEPVPAGSLNGLSVNGFSIGKYEVTQKEYKAVMGDNPSYFQGDDLPVESISWYEAVDFCNKLSDILGKTRAYDVNGNNVTLINSANGYRLPTEQEWEYACNAGNGNTKFGTGKDNAIDPEELEDGKDTTVIEAGWFQRNSGERTNKVGVMPRQKVVKTDGTIINFTSIGNSWGLYDMHGNVSEWCYNIAYGNSSNRVTRGGSYNSDAVNIESSARSSHDPTNSSSGIGFRVAHN
jgi:formylglycine-generating enzyme required for sulfatase activity